MVGGGITMCEKWKKSFERFLDDVGSRPSSSHSLDRIDNNGNYEPGNVKWVLPIEQVRNRSITFKVNDQYINLRELAKELKIHPKTIKNLLSIAKFTLTEVKEFAKLSHYQKIKMGESINNNQPFSLEELEKIKSPAKPSPKRHPLRATWHSMKQRCNNPKNKDFHNYGARGIKVCNEWEYSFENFLKSIMNTLGSKPSVKYQLDRIDNNKHYEPGNVRWATAKEQARNKRLTIMLNGEAIATQEMGKKYDLSYHVVSKLIRLGWNEKGLGFFSNLTFKEKKTLRIFAGKLLQETAIQQHKMLNFSSNNKHQED